MKLIVASMFLAIMAGCGPTPQEQAAMDAAQRAGDQQKCSGYGFAMGTDAFAHCMMGVNGQRDAEQAADRRAAQARAAADQRASDRQRAAQDAADRDAWDRRTGQGAYSSPPPRPSRADYPASTASRIPGMECTGTGEEATCNAR
jgi:hypothetical protein